MKLIKTICALPCLKTDWWFGTAFNREPAGAESRLCYQKGAVDGNMKAFIHSDLRGWWWQHKGIHSVILGADNGNIKAYIHSDLRGRWWQHKGIHSVILGADDVFYFLCLITACTCHCQQIMFYITVTLDLKVIVINLGMDVIIIFSVIRSYTRQLMWYDFIPACI